MKSINKLPGGKFYLAFLNHKQFSRPLEVFSHIELIPPKQNNFVLHKIMFFVIEAELPNSYWEYLVILIWLLWGVKLMFMSTHNVSERSGQSSL